MSGRSVKERLAEHKSDIKKADDKKAVSKQFLDHGYSSAQLSIKPFMKITDPDLFVRLEYQQYLSIY